MRCQDYDNQQPDINYNLLCLKRHLYEFIFVISLMTLCQLCNISQLNSKNQKEEAVINYNLRFKLSVQYSIFLLIPYPDLKMMSAYYVCSYKFKCTPTDFYKGNKPFEP